MSIIEIIVTLIIIGLLFYISPNMFVGPVGPAGPVGPIGPAGPAGPNSIPFVNSKEVFTGLTLCNIDNGKIVTTTGNVPGVVSTDSNGVSTLTPSSIQNGGSVTLIAITATLDPATASFKSGTTFQFFIGTNGDYSVMPSGGYSSLYFEGNNGSPKTFYYYPGKNGFPNLNLRKGNTFNIKGIQTNGILNNVTIGVSYTDVIPPSSW